MSPSSLPRWWLVGATALAIVACDPAPAPTAPEATPAAPTTATLAVSLDGTSGTPIVLPATTGRWSLTALLPAELPAPERWTSIDITGASGQLMRLSDYAVRQERETFEVVADESGVRLEQRIRVGPDTPPAVRHRAKAPLRVITQVSAIAVFTGEREKSIGPPRKLRVEVDGRGAGAFSPQELRGLQPTKDPCRPEHDAGYRLADLVALRSSTEALQSVRLVTSDDSELAIDLDTLRNDSESGVRLRIKANKQGLWRFKIAGPAPDCTVKESLHEVSKLVLTTSQP